MHRKCITTTKLLALLLIQRKTAPFCPSVLLSKKRDKEIMRYMKKSYSAPLCYVVEIAPCGVIATSPLQVENKEQWKDNDFDGEATGAVRGDWSDIWNGM